MDARRAELRSWKTGALRKRARAVGADLDKVEEAVDDDDKRAIVELVLDAEAAGAAGGTAAAAADAGTNGADAGGAQRAAPLQLHGAASATAPRRRDGPAPPTPRTKRARRNYGHTALSAEQVEALLLTNLPARPLALDLMATPQAELGGWVFRETGKRTRPADPRADKWRRGGGAADATDLPSAEAPRVRRRYGYLISPDGETRLRYHQYCRLTLSSKPDIPGTSEAVEDTRTWLFHVMPEAPLAAGQLEPTAEGPSEGPVESPADGPAASLLFRLSMPQPPVRPLAGPGAAAAPAAAAAAPERADGEWTAETAENPAKKQAADSDDEDEDVDEDAAKSNKRNRQEEPRHEKDSNYSEDEDSDESAAAAAAVRHDQQVKSNDPDDDVESGPGAAAAACGEGPPRKKWKGKRSGVAAAADSVTSEYVGVRWDRKGLWKASICVDYKEHFLGYFEDEHEAAAAYVEGAARLRPDGAMTTMAERFESKFVGVV